MSTRSQTPPESSAIATFTRRVDETNRGRSWIRRLLRRAFPGRAEFEQVLLAALSGLAQEAARDREAVEAVRRQTALLELLADGLRNAFRACETTIREQAEASAEQHDDALRRVLRLDQMAGEVRNDLAALGRAQAAASGRLAGIEQRQAAAAESTQAEIAALRARLVETVGAAAGQHDDVLQRMLRLDQMAGEARNDLAALGQAQAAVSGRLAGIEQRQAAAAESIRAESGALRARLAETDGEFKELLAGTNRALAELQAETARQQRSVGENLESFRQQAAVLAARVAEAGAALPSTELVAQLSQLDRRLQALESIAVAALPGSPGMGSFASRMIAVEAAMPALQRALSVQTSAAPPGRGGAEAMTGSAFERFYLAFEDRYRGTRQDIATRQKIYLPYLETRGVLGPGRRAGARVADLGCGRGEWLELLIEAGATGAVGVDNGPEMIDLCRQRGLPVEQSDALDFLRRQPDRSLAAITALHLVEHMPFAALLAILGEARRALEPGGLLVMETPNCGNLLVASNSFHLDPTHRSPLPPLLLSFSAEHAGFREIKTLLLHPYALEDRVADSSPLAARFNEFFYGPQDYAVIAYNA